MKIQTSKPSKRFRVKWSSIQLFGLFQFFRKVKDYPWVQPQDNSALGQINVTHVCTFLNRPNSINSIIIFVWLIRKYLKYRFPWYKKWLEINHKLVPIESDIYILQFARPSVFFHFAHFWLWCTFCTKLVMSAEEPFV